MDADVNLESGDVFWATAQNTSLLYVSSGGTVIMKGEPKVLLSVSSKAMIKLILALFSPHPRLGRASRRIASLGSPSRQHIRRRLQR